MADTPRPVHCPLLAKRNTNVAETLSYGEYNGEMECMGKQCAWWVEEYQADMSGCAIVKIAKMLQVRS